MTSVKTDFPELAPKNGILPVPEMSEGIAAAMTCYPCKAKDMKAIALPTERVPDWQNQAVAKLRELLTKYRSLPVYLDICAQCGACADKCQFYLGTGDPNNMPVARANLLRKVYRYYFKGLERFTGGDAEAFNENVLREWYTYFYQCSECRRCSVFCPYGIDTAEITMAAREIMAAIGVATKYVTEVVAKVYERGNNLGIPAPAWIDNCQFLEEELKNETGKDIRLPVDEVGAEVLLVMPSADNFANTDTMMAYAKLFHYLGISWTTSTYANEGGNFGLFLNFRNLKKVNKRIVDAARQLQVKKIIWGECGHAWRAGIYTPTLNGPLDFLEEKFPIHICQFTDALLKRGAFKLDKSGNDDVIVTYHDPCNPARAGSLLEEPRAIIRATCNQFIEMPRDTIREKTFCCGAGGGLLTDEIMPIRMAGGRPRAEACRSTGATYLATPCAICKAQLPEVMKHWKVDVRVGGVHDLFVKALVW